MRDKEGSFFSYVFCCYAYYSSLTYMKYLNAVNLKYFDYFTKKLVIRKLDTNMQRLRQPIINTAVNSQCSRFRELIMTTIISVKGKYKNDIVEDTAFLIIFINKKYLFIEFKFLLFCDVVEAVKPLIHIAVGIAKISHW